ncbi:hypothetical protein AAE478_009871 [Parahypoxylon ruwenzoriense]
MSTKSSTNGQSVPKDIPRRRSKSSRSGTRALGVNPSVMPGAHQPVAPREYPRSIFEYIYHAVVGDPDAKWGPFRSYVREAKKEGRWREWSIRQIARAAPKNQNTNLGSSNDDDDNADYNGEEGEEKRLSEFEFKLNDFKADNRPAHIDLVDLLQRSSHPKDYDDDFFRKHYSNLYFKTVRFAQKWFDGEVDLSGIGGDEIWGSPMTTQFIQYAHLVAHEDQMRGGWPIILNNPKQRRWLIVGILAQIIEKKVFNELLFGAETKTREELERLDETYLQEEGYDRKAMRVITAGYGIRGGLIPQNFWVDADELTAKTMKVFLPLLNVFKEIWPKAETYTQELFLQELHNIISYAGMIQVCMAISPSIFHFLSATPGARMDYAIEKQSDMQLYRESKEFYEELDEEWQKQIDIAMKEGKTEIDHPLETIRVPIDATERRAMEYHRIRGARVKFAVFPKVTRYKPHNKGKGLQYDDPYGRILANGPDWEELEDEAEGQSIVDISDCRVVYYQGLIYPPSEFEEGEPLDDHIDRFPRRINGLIDFVKRVTFGGYSTARTLTPHFLVISVVAVLAALVAWSLYLARDFIAQFARYWYIAFVWAMFGLHRVSERLREKNWRYANLVFFLPLLVLIFIGMFFARDEIMSIPPALIEVWQGAVSPTRIDQRSPINSFKNDGLRLNQYEQFELLRRESGHR